MATASSNLARIRIIPETVFGQIPTAGNPKDVRFTGESLQFAITTETSQEIRADRNVADLIQTGAESSGDINYELSYGSFDDLFAAALANDWVGDELINGTMSKFFTVEQGFTDINQFIAFRGMGVNTMSLEFATESIITGAFGFMGADSIRSGSTNLPGTAIPAPTTEVMDSVAGFADLIVGGQAYPCGISRVALNTTNNLRAQKALGKLGACALNLGTFSATGEIVVYFSDGVLYDRYIKNQVVSLAWTVKDRAGNEYKFTIPRLKFSDGTVNAGGLDQDVELTLPFQALFDPVLGCAIKIERVPTSGTTPTPPSNLTAPSVTGTAQVGETLTADPGTWEGSPAPTFAYLWKADGVAISGATGNTYELQASDENAMITVTVTASNTEGSASEDSPAVGPVLA